MTARSSLSITVSFAAVCSVSLLYGQNLVSNPRFELFDDWSKLLEEQLKARNKAA